MTRTALRGLSGEAELAVGWRNYLSAWEEWRVEADDCRELDDERVLVLAHLSARQDKRTGGRTASDESERPYSTSVAARSEGSLITRLQSARSPTSASDRRLVPAQERDRSQCQRERSRARSSVDQLPRPAREVGNAELFVRRGSAGEGSGTARCVVVAQAKAE